MAESKNSSARALAPIFLEFGRSVFICQCFEASLNLLLATIAHQESGGDTEQFQTTWDFHSNHTLGRMLRSLRRKVEVSAEADAFLEAGIRYRNEIVHGFLTKNTLRLAEPKQRMEILAELARLKGEVKQRDIFVNKLLDSFLSAYGLSVDLLKEQADRLWEFHNAGDESPGADGLH